MFKKILIANRGEIACRIIETARRLGVLTVAVYSDADRRARHVRMADEAVHIGGAAAADSYLKADVILQVAKDTGAEAVHPGYGFLSENTDFAKACEKAGIKFIGPSAQSIDAMGLKDKAKDIMRDAGVPVVPGYQGDNQDAAFLQKQANQIGYPVLIKAVAGGGGKGMRLVEAEKEFADALKSCQRESKASFSNDHVLIEKYITKPRHVEVQVFGDSHGNAVHLYERDCSLQRRHQKVVEEAPAPDLKADVRTKLGDAAVKAVQALKYENAGTIEFIMDSVTQEFFFMEMNTRLQVEHPVTEMITGLDLVEWQLRVAVGEKLPLTQKEIKCEGHAFEVRLYAEDPANEFLPQTGRVERFFKADNVRLDTAVDEGDSVTIYYDPMIAKIIVHGKDRDAAVTAMQRALAGSGIAGLNTNQEFLGNIFAHKDFIAAKVDTGFIPRFTDALMPANYGQARREELALAAAWLLGRGHSERQRRISVMPEDPSIAALIQDDMRCDPWLSSDHFRMGRHFTTTLNIISKGEAIDLNVAATDHGYKIIHGKKHFAISDIRRQGAKITVHLDGVDVMGQISETSGTLTVFCGGRVVPLVLPGKSGAEEQGGNGRIVTPMPGKIIDVLVKHGDIVSKDQPLLIMEAMKMEMTIRADCDGVIDELPVSANDQVADGALLIAIKGEDAA